MEHYKVGIANLCHVIPRGHPNDDAASFAGRVEILQHYLDVVLSVIPNVFFFGYIKLFITRGKIFICLMASTLTQLVSTIYIRSDI